MKRSRPLGRLDRLAAASMPGGAVKGCGGVGRGWQECGGGEGWGGGVEGGGGKGVGHGCYRECEGVGRGREG